MRRPSNRRPSAEKRPRVEELDPSAWPLQTVKDKQAERLATHFGLGYLSAEGFSKLAALLEWVRPIRLDPPPTDCLDDILLPSRERVG